MKKNESFDKIAKFQGEYRWLSNFWPCAVDYDGITFRSSEAAYQAAKVDSDELRKEFENLSAKEAKAKGQVLEKKRLDWDKVKNDIMYEICREKFTKNHDLKEKLLATGEAELVEGNDWGDTYWGVCDGEGENHLGKILMRIRQELRQNSNI